MINTVSSTSIVTLFVISLSISCLSAPTSGNETETTGTTRSDPTYSIDTTITTDLTGNATTTSTARSSSNSPPSSSSTSTSTTPTPEQPSTTDTPEVISSKDTSTFTCQGKINGYYADVKLGCRVYHFCTRVDGIGEASTYQRMSYICLEGSIFDQRDLNCVNERDLKVPCNKAEEEYERSNKQFDDKDEPQPSMSDNLAANIMMNPVTRFLAGR